MKLGPRTYRRSASRSASGHPGAAVAYFVMLAVVSACGSGASGPAGDSGGAGGSGGAKGTGGALASLGGHPASGSAGGSGGSGGSLLESGGAPNGAGGDAPSAGGSPGAGGDTSSVGGTLTGSGGDLTSSGGSATGTGGTSSSAPLAYVDNCKICHGESAEGDPMGGPQILGTTSEMMYYLVRFGDSNETVNSMSQIVGHPEEMDSFDPSVLSDQDIEDILAWIAEKPRPTAGAELFAQYCSFCHGASGKGGDTEYATAYHSAPFSRQDLASFTTYVQAGHVSESGMTIDPSERRKYMPPFDTVLSSAEISLIYNWAKAQ